VTSRSQRRGVCDPTFVPTTLWKIRCVIAWSCRALALVVSIGVTVFLLDRCLEAVDACTRLFPLGTAEIVFVGASTFVIVELIGRLLPWTNPNSPLPRIQDGQ
jgi:hypothetical protein